MGILSFIVLSGAIGINVSNETSSEYKDAYKALFKASYIETGADKKLKQLEERYNPEFLQKHGGVIVGIVKIATEKQISFQWTF